MDVADVLERLGELRVVAVLRGDDADTTIRIGRELVAAGVRALEVTCTTPDAPRVLRELSGGGALLGAGSVTRPAQLDAVVEAGARFVVSPVDPPFLVPAAADAGVLAVPGCATPGEVWRAVQRGALAVKLFPIARLGGAAYLRDLAGPLPGLRLVPSGGVGLDDVAGLLGAGAWCVGLGSALTGPMAAVERRKRSRRLLTTLVHEDERAAAPPT